MTLGLIDLPWWGYVLVTLGLTHITIAAVTIFLHRSQAHRAVELHPAVNHFFRFWLWFTTGMVTREWVAVHRKHHARVETPEDPHSPMVYGIRKVFWEGVELYREAAKDPETIEKYGRGTPDDWIERTLYARNTLGLALLLLIDLVLFGPIGLTVWAVQMIWIPLFAAGVINGLGHYRGYRNFACEDASTNVLPWGILIGGEELHNNHHAYGSSAKLSSKWFEFDIGWMYIRILSMLGLADVRRVAPRLNLRPAHEFIDLATLQAVVTHRYDVMARFMRAMQEVCAKEFDRMRSGASPAPGFDMKQLRRWLRMDPAALGSHEQAGLRSMLEHSQALATLYEMRQELVAVWGRSTASKEQLVQQLQAWCQRAEASGIEALREFSLRLRCYA
jgi:stearoyl-CoA desaturase (delta-9 desaturase)